MPNQSKSVVDLYRDFETVGITGARRISRLVNSDKFGDEIFEKIFTLLYPENGALESAEKFWEEFSALAAVPANSAASEKRAARAELAKLMRVYYASLSADKPPLEAQLKDFYAGDAGGRPSAYRAYRKDHDSKEPGSYSTVDSPLRAIVSRGLGLSASGENATPPDASPRIPSLMYVLLDTPNIDIKLRNADKAAVFLNYMPSIIASQLQPFLDVEFNMSRKETDEDNANSRLSTMSQLKFLLGPEPVVAGSADAQIYKASTFKQVPTQASEGTTATAAEALYAKAYADWSARKALHQRKYQVKKAGNVTIQPPPFTEPEPINPSKAPKVETPASSTPKGKVSISTGIELFTMPQTLLNMDPNSNKGRFQPVINPTMPFGAITNLTIDIRPSVGVMSFKTATLTLKIFDRSRLVEIADFLNPKLYQAVTLWLTYGWRAPIFPPQTRPGAAQDIKIYADFINENMLRREAYGVRNVSINTEPNGVTTVTLSLFTRAGAELLEVKDAKTGAFDKVQEQIGAKLERLQQLAKKFQLESYVEGGKELRGSQVISAALAGDVIAVDIQELSKIAAAISTSLKKKGYTEGAELEKLIKELYGKVGGDSNSNLQNQLDTASRALAGTRFSELESNGSFYEDVFALPNNADIKSDKFAEDPQSVKPPTYPLAALYASFSNDAKYDASVDDPERRLGQSYGDFGRMSFGRVFAHYFAAIAQSLTNNNVVDDIQVVFYRLNSLAGPVANLNIAEFPIDMGALLNAYSKKVSEQKGENMSFTTFLEIIKDSQFSSMTHRAFGFTSLYVPDKKTGKLVPRDNDNGANISKRALENFGLPGPFTLPALEFYIETSYSNASNDLQKDALNSIDFARGLNAGNGNTSSTKKIMRIHVFDKAATPHKAAMQILKNGDGYVEVDSEIYKALEKIDRNSLQNLAKSIEDIKAASEKVSTALAEFGGGDAKIKEESLIKLAEALGLQRSELTPDKINALFRTFTFKDTDDSTSPASFEKVKRQISKLVPTITIGCNGSMVESSNYATGNDALLSTIMMLRNSQSAPNPAQPNGAGVGDLPLRIVPGSLTVNTLGCPLVEYMQQFFVDLGTGTTADNLYNITGLTHTFTPSKFSTQIKFTFADAYGSYESAQSFVDGVTAKVANFKNQLEAAEKAQEEKKKRGGVAKRNP